MRAVERTQNGAPITRGRDIDGPRVRVGHDIGSYANDYRGKVGVMTGRHRGTSCVVRFGHGPDATLIKVDLDNAERV